MPALRTRTALAGTALAGALALLSACGGSSGSDDGPGTTAAAPSSAISSTSPSASPSPTEQPQLINGKPNAPGVVNAILADATCTAMLGAPKDVVADKIVTPAKVYNAVWPDDQIPNPLWIPQALQGGSGVPVVPGTCSYVASATHSVGFSFVVTDSRTKSTEPNDFAAKGTLIAAATSGQTTVSLYGYRNSAANPRAFDLATDAEGGPAISFDQLPGYVDGVKAALQSQVTAAFG